MYVRCQACGVTLDVRDDVARTAPQIPCASCGRPVSLMAGAAVVAPPTTMTPPPVAVQPQTPAVAVTPPAAPGGKSAQYAMAGLGGVVVLLIGVVITLVMNRGGDVGTPAAAVAQTPVSLDPTPAPQVEDDVPEQPDPEPLPGDLPAQVTYRQKQVSALQQELIPLRTEKERLEAELKLLTDSE